MRTAVFAIVLGSIVPLAGCNDQRNPAAPPPPVPNRPAVEERPVDVRPAVETRAPGVDVKTGKGNVDVKAPGVDVEVERNKNR